MNKNKNNILAYIWYLAFRIAKYLNLLSKQSL